MAILLRCRAGFHLPADHMADQNRQLPSPLCRQAPPCHPARPHSVVHVDARIPSGPESAKLPGPHEVNRSTGNALQRFQGQRVERLWRSVKYEEVYLRAYDTVTEARNSLANYFSFYNSRRPHSSLDRQTPDQAYFTPLPQIAAA
jgi:putative transposase